MPIDRDTLQRWLVERRTRFERWRRDERRATTLAVGLLFFSFASAVAANNSWLPGAWSTWLTGSLLALACATTWRVRATRRRRAARYSVEWLESAIARLEDRFDLGQPDGAEYGEDAHPFARDLDLFGSGSLYERVAATHTVLGRDALAALLRGDDLAPLVDRQALIRELSEAWELREDLELAWCTLRDRNPKDARELDRLERDTRSLLEPAPAWLADPPGPLLTRVKWIGTSLGTLAVIGTLTHLWPFSVLLAVWAALLGVLALVSGPVGQRMGAFEVLRSTFEAWSTVLSRLEAWQPESAEGRRRVAVLQEGSATASAVIRQLKARADRLSWRRNTFFAFTINVLWLWDLHAWASLASWWRQHGHRVPLLFEAAARLEAEVALASYAAGVPEACTPEAAPDSETFEAEGLAHPLLPRSERVANDLALTRRGEVALITGSNMSGKSTFLRAAGLAVVMARLGLPVAAKRCRLHPELSVVTCMRVEDSLQRGASRFFAEATRLVECVRRLDEAPVTLVLLDEILAGTNSHERHAATRALLNTLTGRSALTLVATHDLALAELAEAHPELVWVGHFRDEARGDEMVFDYRLRPGVLPTTNAIRVLRALGLPGLD